MKHYTAKQLVAMSDKKLRRVAKKIGIQPSIIRLRRCWVISAILTQQGPENNAPAR